MTKEETMKAIAEGRCDLICPIIEKMAQLTIKGFDYAAEHYFKSDEDFLLFDLLLRLAEDDMYFEAVDVLIIFFSLTDMKEAMLLTTIIAASDREDVHEAFMDYFLTYADEAIDKRMDYLIEHDLV